MTLSVSMILLAGGSGTRMQSSTPKQYLELDGKPIALHSLELFLTLPYISEIIVVCDNAFRHYFNDYCQQATLKFAAPGPRRQDSVYNGFGQIAPDADIVCIHDAARPLLSAKITQEVITEANEVGASAAAVPLKSTIKEADSSGFVVQTPDRSRLWEIQTPQAARPNLLAKGFAEANRRQLDVTDDVSLIELLNLPVKLVLGSYDNIKITTPEDLELAKLLIQKESHQKKLETCTLTR